MSENKLSCHDSTVTVVELALISPEPASGSPEALLETPSPLPEMPEVPQEPPVKLLNDRMSFYLGLLKHFITVWVVSFHAVGLFDHHVWQIFIPRFLAGDGEQAVAIFFGISGFLNANSLLRDATTIESTGRFAVSRVRRQYRRWGQLQLPVLLMTTVTLPLFSLIFGDNPSHYCKDALTPGYWLLRMLPFWHPWQDTYILKTTHMYVWFNVALVQLDFFACIFETCVHRWLHRNLKSLTKDDTKACMKLLGKLTGIMTGVMVVVLPIHYLVIAPWQEKQSNRYNMYYHGLTWVQIYVLGYFFFFARAVIARLPSAHPLRRPASWPNIARIAACAVAYIAFEAIWRSVAMHELQAIAWHFNWVILLPIVFDCLPDYSPIVSQLSAKLDFLRLAIFIEHSYYTEVVSLPRMPMLIVRQAVSSMDAWTPNVYAVMIYAVYAFLFTPSAFLFRGAARMMDNIWTCFTCDAARRRQLLRHALCWNLPVGVGCVVVASLALTGTLGFTEYPRNKWMQVG